MAAATDATTTTTTTTTTDDANSKRRNRDKDGWFSRHQSELPAEILTHVDSLTKKEKTPFVNNIVARGKDGEWSFKLDSSVVRETVERKKLLPKKTVSSRSLEDWPRVCGRKT